MDYRQVYNELLNVIREVKTMLEKKRTIEQVEKDYQILKNGSRNMSSVVDVLRDTKV